MKITNSKHKLPNGRFNVLRSEIDVSKALEGLRKFHEHQLKKEKQIAEAELKAPGENERASRLFAQQSSTLLTQRLQEEIPSLPPSQISSPEAPALSPWLLASNIKRAILDVDLDILEAQVANMTKILEGIPMLSPELVNTVVEDTAPKGQRVAVISSR